LWQRDLWPEKTAREISALAADETVRIWTRGHYRRESDGRRPEGMMKIDLPLDSNGARLLLAKDINRDPLNYYTLRRLEHLRRTLLTHLARLKK
jgi:hypothetical protein